MILLSFLGGGLWIILLVLGLAAGYAWYRFIAKGFYPALYAAIILTIALIASFFGMLAEK